MRNASGPDAKPWRLPVQLAAAGLTALALTAAISLPAASAASAAGAGKPPSFTRAQSIQYARSLEPRIVLPSGALRLPQRPVPPGLRHSAGFMIATHSVDIYRLYKLPGSLTASERFLTHHVPAGMTNEGTGKSWDRHGLIEEDVTFVPGKLPRGVSSADLVATVVHAPHHHSYLRVDAQVIWYPARSAAEHLAAKNYSSVRITAWIYGHRAHRVSKTFSSGKVIRRLVRLLDSLPASPGGVTPCPLILVTYRLTFFPAGSAPEAVVSRFGCTSDGVQVGGVAQPALSDYGRLSTLAGRIMHIRQPVLRPATAARHGCAQAQSLACAPPCTMEHGES
jgi:hypothetical protein